MKDSALGRGDPEKRREFLKRGEQSGARSLQTSARAAALARTRLERTVGPKRRRKPRPPEGPLTRVAWEAEVYRLDEGRCVVTRRPIRVPRPINFHHVIPKQRLRRDGRHDIVFDPDNGALVLDDVHANHEAASSRIPREKLPARCIAFAERHGYGWYIERTYPAAAASSGER